MAFAVVMCSGCNAIIDARNARGGVGLCDKCQSKARRLPQPTQERAATTGVAQPSFGFERRFAGWLSIVWIGMALSGLLAMFMCFWSILRLDGESSFLVVPWMLASAFNITGAAIGWLLSNLLRVTIEMANRPDRQW